MSILDAIKKQRLSSDKRSYSASERFESNVRAQAEYTKLVISGEAEDLDEMQMATLYGRMRSQYSGKPHMFKELNNRSKSFWRRVITRQKESGVAPEKFLTAQFDWFHSNFGRIPDVVQLTTEAAVTRAREYAGKDNKKVTATTREEKANFADLMRHSEKMMRDICKAQGMTRLEVYTNLIIPGHFTFPKQYLDSDPIYRQALEAR